MSDVCLVVGDKRIYANKAILAIRSPVFKSMLFGSFGEAQKKEVAINDPHITFNAFQTFILFVYSGKIEVTPENVLVIMYLAKKYQFNQLSQHCSSCLTKWVNKENALELWSSADLIDDPTISQHCESIVPEL
uniref:BTB domain-containing protein n=1 Tax=Arcella intermedia TaxID=1963864 RepID=A0A6B2LQJ6_9EUKA